MISETTSSLLLLRPNNSFHRFHTASVKRRRGGMPVQCPFLPLIVLQNPFAGGAERQGFRRVGGTAD